MIDKHVLHYLALGHGSFNSILFLFILYQAFLGYRIRTARMTHARAADDLKRHRRNGPFLVALGMAGFVAGMVLVYLDYGQILKYPLHFINGSAIAASLAGLFLISKKIKGDDARWRNAHVTLGMITVGLYLFQLILGLRILL